MLSYAATNGYFHYILQMTGDVTKMALFAIFYIFFLSKEAFCSFYKAFIIFKYFFNILSINIE